MLLDMAVFDRWFAKLDRDGDGKLEIVDIANYLKLLLLGLEEAQKRQTQGSKGFNQWRTPAADARKSNMGQILMHTTA